MRLKIGRPDLAAYSTHFDLPRAAADAPLTVSWAGVTTLLIDDGSSAVMTDGFFSRPSLFAVAARPLTPSRRRIDAALSRLRVQRLDAVTPVHTHFDHAMDSAVVADLTGARLIGGTSAGLIARGHGLTSFDLTAPGQSVQAGAYDITLIEGAHCPPDRFPGVITEPVTPP
ncbi:MBL fold metallo-hydrolase, partial [Mycobacterium sp. ITM-2017-0098]